MISEDEYLERIVAGIHSVTTKGADVRWNEVINGRQFDVVVRFTLGTLGYLVLIEVKNRTRKASAEDLDAFVTKARDQLASKAVFVTAAGFQSGAITTAERHGIDLFTVAFDEEILEIPPDIGALTLVRTDGPKDEVPTLSIGDPEPGLCIAAVTLIYADGKHHSVPSEASQMRYYIEKTRVEHRGSLKDLLDEQDFCEIAVGEKRKHRVKLRQKVRIAPPDNYFFPSGTLSALDFALEGVMGRSITGNVRIDPAIFRHPVVYTNVRTGEISRFATNQLPLGGGPVKAGRFYFGLHPLSYYHCADVGPELVTWNLIESFQSGMLISGTYTQKLLYAPRYIPVTDKATLARLVGRLDDYRRKQAGETISMPDFVPKRSRRERLTDWIKRL